MKSLLVYLKEYKKESALAPLFKMLEAIFELIVPLVIASIIDKGILENNKSVILSRAGILILLATVGMVAAITAQYFAAKAATGFGREVRKSLFEKIQSLSFTELDSLGTSRLITIMTNDTAQVQNGVNMVLRLLLRSPFIVLGAMIMSFTVDARCALVFLVTIPLLTIVVFAITKYTIPRYKKVQFQLDEITKKTSENLEGARVIRAFVQEENEIASFDKENIFLSHIQKAVGRISALLNPVTLVIINISIAVLIYLGAIRVNSGSLTQGEVVALYNYMSQILVELLKLANLIVLLTKSLACGSRIEAVLKTENTLEHIEEADNKDSSFAVSFENESFKYKNASASSLENISFTAKKGEVVGIIGGTGSGKTSLVSLIPHFYDAFDGAVCVNGKNVKAYSDDELRGIIGFAFQRAALFKGSVRENLLWGKANASDDELYSALKAAQIYDDIIEKGGLDAQIEQAGSNLSGGQKQRLNIARALVRRPEILVFDDSFSALDYVTEAALRKAVLSLENKPTVFIVSQRASSVIPADKIIVLDDGRAVGIGNHKELLDSCDIYKEIYASQFGKEAAV